MSQALLEWSGGTVGRTISRRLRLFRYITFRSAGAAVTALVLSWWLGPRVIAWLKRMKFGQDYADKAEEAGGMVARVLSKKGTPTMGGILIVMTLSFTTLLWARLDNQLVLLTLLLVLVLTGLGFYDDYAKIIQQTSGGTKPSVKLWVQIALAVFIGAYLWRLPATSKLITEIMVPFYKYPVATGAGLVGLADYRAGRRRQFQCGQPHRRPGWPGDWLHAHCRRVFLVMTYIAGNAIYARYLQVPSVPGAGELTVFCAGMIGAGPGFPVVQLPPGAGVHGRHRLAGAGRRAGAHGGADSPAVRAGDCGRRVRHGGGFGDFAARLVPLHPAALRNRAAAFFDGADSSSLREKGLV